MEEILEVDYSKIDKIVEEMIKEVHSYMINVPEKLVKDNIEKAYFFAKEAHH